MSMSKTFPILLLSLWPCGHWGMTQQPRTVAASTGSRLRNTEALSESTRVNSMVVMQSGAVASARALASGKQQLKQKLSRREALLESWNQNLTNLTCASEDAVWLLVLKETYKTSPVDRQRFNMLVSRSPICVQILRPAHTFFRNFWEEKQVTVRDYLLDNPSVKFIIVTDTFDVYANPISRSELFSRFDHLTEDGGGGGGGDLEAGALYQGKARVLFATEQNCYLHFQCNTTEAQQWLDHIRPGQGRSDARSFSNSQYMGDRKAVLDFLTAAMNIAPGVKGFSQEHHPSDQAMFAKAIAASPKSATLDFDEVIFASFFRGFIPVEDGNFTCNFGGRASMPCDVQWNWGNCTRSANGTVAVQEAVQESRRTVLPFLWHLNGPARRSAKRSHGCYEAFDSLPMGL